jgi:hypothetical protein
MSKPLKDLATRGEAIARQRVRAEHHGPNVHAVLPALWGYVEMFGHDVEVMTRLGVTGNITWFRSKKTNKWYCFGYNHGTAPSNAFVELRDGNMQGKVIMTFTNATTMLDLYKLFGSL